MAKKEDKEIEELRKEIKRLRSQLAVYQNELVQSSSENDKSYRKLLSDALETIDVLVKKIRDLGGEPW